MQRQIKFRIWDKEYKHWLENDSSLHCFSDWQMDPFTGQISDFVGVIMGEEERRSKNTSFKKDNFVVQQFTGLLDFKKEEIYEGDILKFHKGEAYESDYEVYWKTCGFSLISAKRDGDKYGVFTKNLENLTPSDKPIIIGNIFEPPQFLK